MNELQEKARLIEVKRGEMAKLFADNKKDGKLSLSADQIIEVNHREEELKGLVAEYTEVKRLADIEAGNTEALAALKAPAGGNLPFGEKGEGGMSPAFAEAKRLGSLFVESPEFKNRGARGVKEVNLGKVEVKTVMQTPAAAAGGYPPQVLRSGVVIYSPQAQPTLIDLIPATTTNQNGYKYMLETTFTNAAAETAEGALASEAALKFTEELSPVVKIPVFIPITEEELADVDGIRDIVDERLILMIKQRINSQLVNGNGIAPNLTGLVNTTGVLTVNKGTDVAPDAIYKGMIQVMSVGFADPSGVWINPLDWQGIRLLKTTQGAYVYGDPSQPGPNTIFGLPVAMHVAVPQGTASVADFQTYTKIAYRNGIEISVSDSHSDYFVRGQLAIRAMIRLAFIVYRPSAVCLVQGL